MRENRPLVQGRTRGMERWHWLLAFCLLSLILHLGVGWNSRHFNFGLPKNITAPQPAEVEISLAPLEPRAATVPRPQAKPRLSQPKPTLVPAKEKPEVNEKPEEKPEVKEVTTPVAGAGGGGRTSRTASAAHEAPKAVPDPDPRLGEAPDTTQAPLTSRETPTETPTATPAPDSVSQPPTRLPLNAPVRVAPPPTTLAMPNPKTIAPVPFGLPTGQRNLPAMKPGLRAPLPSVARRPLPTEAESKGSSGTTIVPSIATPEAKNAEPDTDRGTGGGKGSDREGTGEATAAGAASASAGMGKYGINRGIPFGDLTGLSRGGDPNGGRGVLGGGVSGGGRSGQPFRITLQTSVPPDSGPALHIIYVLDTSGSMLEGNKIVRARDALRQALSELRPDDEFNIIAFSDTAHKQFKQMRTAKNSAVSAGTMGIELLQPHGNTNIEAAMDLALDEPGITHIFLLSDGAPTEGIIDFEELRAHIREKNRAIGARILTLAIGLGEQFDGIDLLKGIAEENEGKFNYINVRKIHDTPENARLPLKKPKG